MSLRREIARQFDSDTKSMRTETSSYPTVSYYTADGRSHTFTSDVASSHKRRDKVRVLYDPHDPEDAKIGSFVMLYGRPIAAITLCAAMCGFFLYMFTLLLQG